MPRSYAQPHSFTCPHCGQSGNAEIWLIVDTDERPDLVEQIRDGSLHDIRCDGCGRNSKADAPLLVHDPAGKQVLFAVRPETPEEQDRRISDYMIQQLAGTFWKCAPDYLRQVKLVSWEQLPPASFGACSQKSQVAAMRHHFCF